MPQASWATASALAALAVADVVLVSFAVLHVREDPPEDSGGDGGPAAGSTTQETDRPEPEPTDDPTGTGPDVTERTGDGSEDDEPVLLDAAADGAVLRATQGGCVARDVQTPSVVEVSVDAGQMFEVVDVGTPLADVLRVSVLSASDMFLVAANPTCAPAVYRSGDGGDTWSVFPGTSGAWHVLTARGRRVHAPSGGVATGCEVLALSSLTESGARVLCTDGRLRGTDDGGSTWVRLGSLEGAVDVVYEDSTSAWAVASLDDCAAAVLRTTNGGSAWQQTACIEADGEPQAVTAADGDVLVQVGGELLVSSDEGRTFVEP